MRLRGELERIGVGIEQAQSAGAVVVVRRQPGGVVAKTFRIDGWRLGLKLSRELADVVEGEEIARQPIGFLARQAEQAGDAVADAAIARQQHLAHCGHVEGVIRQRMPSGPASGVARPGLSPEAQYVRHVPMVSQWPRSGSTHCFNVHS